MAVFMDPSGARLYVAEYGNGQVTEVSLTDGAKKVVAAGLAGPVALTIIDGKLYVAETKAGRISKVDPATGDQEVFCAGVAGRPNAVGNDGSGNLLFLDGGGQKLYRLNTRNMDLSVVAEDLPVGYSTLGSYPPTEFPWPMAVGPTGDIYLATLNRGMIILQKK
jgi:outer membrane protein assembly factor BamB